MPRSLQFTLLFIVVALLQLFLFNNMNLSIYIHPLIYLAFIVLLPMDLAPVWVLLSGFTMGLVMDVCSASAGINCAALLFTSFARPVMLQLSISKDDMRDGGIPNSARLGTGGFLKYCFALVFIHCLIYFSLEAATLSYYYLTMLRIIASAIITTLLIYLFQLLYVNR